MRGAVQQRIYRGVGQTAPLDRRVYIYTHTFSFIHPFIHSFISSYTIYEPNQIISMPKSCQCKCKFTFLTFSSLYLSSWCLAAACGCGAGCQNGNCNCDDSCSCKCDCKSCSHENTSCGPSCKCNDCKCGACKCEKWILSYLDDFDFRVFYKTFSLINKTDFLKFNYCRTRKRSMYVCIRSQYVKINSTMLGKKFCNTCEQFIFMHKLSHKE